MLPAVALDCSDLLKTEQLDKTTFTSRKSPSIEGFLNSQVQSGKANTSGELRGDFLRGSRLVVDTDCRGGVEGLHYFEIVRVTYSSACDPSEDDERVCNARNSSLSLSGLIRCSNQSGLPEFARKT